MNTQGDVTMDAIVVDGEFARRLGELVAKAEFRTADGRLLVRTLHPAR